MELPIPAHGTGGSWIDKLPSTKFERFTENEFSMISLAGKIGIDIPDIKLVHLNNVEGLPEGNGDLEGSFPIRRFDRTGEGGSVHIEDFAQVFEIFPEDKYKRASTRNLAEVIAAKSGQQDIAEQIRRLVFNTLIGNADMHLKNSSFVYPDRKNARLAPGYDFLSTIPYIKDTNAALTIGRSKKMQEFSLDEFAYLAGKARLPEKLVLDTAKETVERFHEVWKVEKNNLALSKKLIETIEAHIKIVPIATQS